MRFIEKGAIFDWFNVIVFLSCFLIIGLLSGCDKTNQELLALGNKICECKGGVYLLYNSNLLICGDGADIPHLDQIKIATSGCKK